MSWTLGTVFYLKAYIRGKIGPSSQIVFMPTHVLFFSRSTTLISIFHRSSLPHREKLTTVRFLLPSRCISDSAPDSKVCVWFWGGVRRGVPHTTKQVNSDTLYLEIVSFHK